MEDKEEAVRFPLFCYKTEGFDSRRENTINCFNHHDCVNVYKGSIIKRKGILSREEI